MKKLSPSWFTDGIIDFEHKKYVLFGYLQAVRDQFNQTRLYPAFSDLIFHYENLRSFREGKRKLNDRFPQKIRRVDFEKMELEYEPDIEEPEDIREIEGIIDFSLPQLESTMAEGREIYEFTSKNLDIGPVGVMPLYRDEGYFFLQQAEQPVIKAFEYRISIFERAGENYRGLYTNYLTSFRWSITNTLENMKLDLISTRKNLPNPATFAVSSTMALPEQETLFPVVKREFIRFLSNY